MCIFEACPVWFGYRKLYYNKSSATSDSTGSNYGEIKGHNACQEGQSLLEATVFEVAWL